MKALLYGVKPESVPVPETDNRLLRSLAQTPNALSKSISGNKIANV